MNELEIRKKLKNDFKFYAAHCLKIRTKDDGLQPFRFNTAQEHIDKRLNEQLERTGRIRAILLKGRQQGASTYTEGRFMWRTTHRKGVRAFILTHESEATNNLFRMSVFSAQWVMLHLQALEQRRSKRGSSLDLNKFCGEQVGL